MSASVEISTPGDGALISAGDTAIVVDVYDTGAHATRQLTVQLAVTVIYTWIAGTTTYIDPDFSVTITTPAANLTRFTFNKLTPWPNPSTVALTAVYAPNPDVLPEVSVVSALCADLVLISANPADQQPNASPQTAVQFVATSTATIDGLTVTINGEQAFDEVGGVQTWARPDFSGAIVNAGAAISGSVVPRRDFSSATNVDIALTFRLTADSVVFISSTISYSFFAVSPTPTQIALAQTSTPLDRPIQGYPALESQRAALLRALSTSAFAPSLTVLASARGLRSSLAPLINSIQPATILAQAEALRAEYQADVVAADLVLDEVSVLWVAALAEARRLGVSPSITAMVARAHDSDFPQERVGAVAALLLALPSAA